MSDEWTTSNNHCVTECTCESKNEVTLSFPSSESYWTTIDGMSDDLGVVGCA